MSITRLSPNPPIYMQMIKKGVAKEVLTQAFRPRKVPVTYLSKRLDPVATGWPPCLPIIVATILLVKDSEKLTWGQTLKVTSPHAIDGVLKYPPDRWLTNAKWTHYQALLLNPPRIQFTMQCLKAATLLPDLDLAHPLHDCVDIQSLLYGIIWDLENVPLMRAEVTWYHLY